MLHLFGIAPVQLLFSPFAVLIAMVYAHLPFMVLPLYTNLEKHDPSLLDAAQDLGANAWQRFWHVTFPLSLPGVFSGSALVFIPALGVFVIPEILGGTGDMLIGNLIKEQFLGTRDWPFGSTLSIMLTIAVLLIAWLTALAGAARRAAMRRNRRVAMGGGAGRVYAFLYLPLRSSCLLVQRFAPECGVGGLHLALVPGAAARRGHADRRRQFAVHRAGVQPVRHRARHHGRHRHPSL